MPLSNRAAISIVLKKNKEKKELKKHNDRVFWRIGKPEYYLNFIGVSISKKKKTG